ncbi:MAG: hypothetical protein AAGB01_00055 [Cyanobacteria bacterium P01_F01_bin.42]
MTYLYESSESDAYTAEADPVAVKLMGVAQDVYFTYYEAHGEDSVAPLGVVVNRKTLRGQLIFTGEPIMLPHESFIPTDQIGYADDEAEEYKEAY